MSERTLEKATAVEVVEVLRDDLLELVGETLAQGLDSDHFRVCNANQALRAQVEAAQAEARSLDSLCQEKDQEIQRLRSNIEAVEAQRIQAARRAEDLEAACDDAQDELARQRSIVAAVVGQREEAALRAEDLEAACDDAKAEVDDLNGELQRLKREQERADLLTRAGLASERIAKLERELEIARARDASERNGQRFNVVLEHCGPKKIATIKVIREITGLPLRPAKDLADCGGTVLASVPLSRARAARRLLELDGAEVTLSSAVDPSFDCGSDPLYTK